jgi:hypothetical protein
VVKVVGVVQPGAGAANDSALPRRASTQPAGQPRPYKVRGMFGYAVQQIRYEATGPRNLIVNTADNRVRLQPQGFVGRH